MPWRSSRRASAARRQPGQRPGVALQAWTGLLALALVGAVCTSGGPQTVRGVVVAVEAHSIARADTLTLRADDGRDLQFRVAPEVDWTPGHLREHAALGDPVVVTFVREDDTLVAVRLADATGAH